MANNQSPKTEQPDDDHSHEIAGFRVGERSVPLTAIGFFILVLAVALIAWIPTQGY
jgi:hypothetical protein